MRIPKGRFNFALSKTKNLKTMDNKILFEEAFKTFDEKRRTRFLLHGESDLWDEDDVTSLMYDVAITVRDTVMKEIVEKLKHSLTDEQLKLALDAIQKPTTSDTKVGTKVKKRRIRDLDISTRAVNCLYANDVFTTDDLLYGNFNLNRFKMARGVGQRTFLEVEDLIARLKKEQEQL